MKFEKVNENKVRIIVDSKDLLENNIDFHSIMSDSTQRQDLFMNILDKAEKEIGFTTKNYRVKIEAFAMNDENFIFTITRIQEKKKKKKDTIKLNNSQFKKKKSLKNPIKSIYRFSSLDDFINFTIELKNSGVKNLNTLSKSIELITYKDFYYLIFTKMNTQNKYYTTIFSILPEFSVNIENSDLFACKLSESGKIYFKHNAIKTCQKYFS